MPYGLVIVDDNERIIGINGVFCDYLGIEKDQAIGRDVHRFFDDKLASTMKTGNGPGKPAVAIEGVDGARLGISRRPVTIDGRQVAWVAIAHFPHQAAKPAEGHRRHGDGEAVTKPHPVVGFAGLSTKSARFAEVMRLANRFADSELPILLHGETGVGKDVFATAIHKASRRAAHPLVCVNCASIPEELLESELFGYVDGAFTGTRRCGKKGKFELADHGTLFLDEIGEMPLQMQSKLLRILQNQEVEKLGAETTVRVNVRIIAATNKNLSEAVRSGTFRTDLYYRLNVLPVTIPPLRDRREDIGGLARQFLSELVATSGRTVHFSGEALKALRVYDWPGNVRELRNVVGCAFMTTEGDTILPEHLHLPVFAEERRETSAASITIQDVRCYTERELIINCLRKYDGNFPRAAHALGIHRTTLYSRLRKLGIPVAAFRPAPLTEAI